MVPSGLPYFSFFQIFCVRGLPALTTLCRATSFLVVPPRKLSSFPPCPAHRPLPSSVVCASSCQNLSWAFAYRSNFLCFMHFCYLCRPLFPDPTNSLKQNLVQFPLIPNPWFWAPVEDLLCLLAPLPPYPLIRFFLRCPPLCFCTIRALGPFRKNPFRYFFPGTPGSTVQA